MPVIIILVIVAVIIIMVVAHAQAEQRRKLLSEWAAGHGLNFSPERRNDMHEVLPEYDLFQQGHSRSGSNFLTGNWRGRSLLAFDYQYTTGSGKHRHTHCYFVAVIESAIPLKPLRIRPENFGDRIAAAFGFDDIDFESAEFSRRFHVSSPDRKWAYDVLHARAMEHLMRHPDHSIEFGPKSLIAYKSGRVEPHELDRAASMLTGLLDLLPDYVTKSQSASY